LDRDPAFSLLLTRAEPTAADLTASAARGSVPETGMPSTGAQIGQRLGTLDENNTASTTKPNRLSTAKGLVREHQCPPSRRHAQAKP